MKAKKLLFTGLLMAFTAFFMLTAMGSVAQAGTDDVLLGFRYCDQAKNDGLGLKSLDDWSKVNTASFAGTDESGNGPYFTTSTLTIGGSSGDVQIGAIWTNETSAGQWRQIRVVIDSDGNSAYSPFDWSDDSHPWNSSGNWTYPAAYPDAALAGTTINVGTNGSDFPWDTFQWWWYESQGGFDKTESWWMEQGNLMVAWWSGRDANWNVLPNGNYGVQVWVDEDGGGTFEADEAQKEGTVAISTAGITGTVKDSVGNGIVGAEVNAGSHKAWGQARTNADGKFTVSGLEAGATYHVRVQATGKVSAQTDVELPANATTASAGTITMQNAIAITGTITMPAAFTAFTNQWGWIQKDMYVWINAWNTQGPGWGNTEVRFEDTDGIGGNSGDQTKSFSINIPPPPTGTTPTYNLNINCEGYAASPDNVTVTSSGGAAGEITLTKASVLTGSVTLPANVSEWLGIDVQAVEKDNSDNRYWGWGQVNGSQTSTNTGTFRIDGVPAGNFNLQVRVWGYASYDYHTENSSYLTIDQGQDKDAGALVISKGSTIGGTLTVTGDTTDLKTWEGEDTSQALNIWIDAWSPAAGWGGTQVSVVRGTNKSASYSIGGLSSGKYEINCWFGEGYELVDTNDNSPIFVTLSSDATQDLKLKPFEGKITGTVSAADAVTGFDINKVVVEAKRPWDWLPPKIATVAKGNIDANGVYTIEGLGTDDYVVKVGLYTGWIDWNGGNQPLSSYTGDGFLIPDSAAGVAMSRVFVQNGATSTHNVTLEKGCSISGTISLSTADAPWHDVNGNGKEDVTSDANTETVSIAMDVAGRMVMAMPMDMMFMGGSDPRMGTIQANGTYQIDGLAPGVYIVMPPFSSRRIEALVQAQSSVGEGAMFFSGGQETHHWATTTRMVVVTDADKEGQNFTLSNGHTITGKLTMPEAQTYTADWEKWQWVGQLELETPSGGFFGHGKPVFKKDFSKTSKYDFTFNHVADGDYLVRFWTDRYVPGGKKVTVSSANATANLTIKKGANLVGKLVDAETGEAITSADGVRVMCEAYPWVEGSWRETRDDDWSSSYIESDEGIKSQDMGGTSGKRENKNPGKFHLTALPDGQKYVVMIETTCGGNKTGGAKNYVGRVMAGIDIPESATGDIDVGTIKLSEGTTIKGRLTDASAAAIAGVQVCAIPSDPHSGSAEATGTSDTNGYYTVYGIDPDVEYYDLIAAERPFLFEGWGKKIEWGQKFMYNVAPKTEAANFTLGATTARLSGKITIPEGSEFMLPFKGEGHSFPVTYILLQKKGVVYKDVLEGIEGITAPTPIGTYEASYTIDNIEPGAYKALIMNYGLPTFVGEMAIVEGDNTLNHTWTSAGYKISGSCALETGGYPSTADISGVICMNTSDRSLIFGQLTKEADGTYSAYEVPGLATGATYQLAFYRHSGTDDMPDVITAGAVFTVDAADIARNATITRNPVPILMIQAIKDAGDSNKINVGIFSTTYLVDKSISVVETAPTNSSTAGELYIKTGAGTLSAPVLSGDKRNVSFSYTKAGGDADVTLTLAVHYGSDATTKLADLTFNVNSAAKNGNVVNVYTAGQVKLGNGDGSQIYIPAGAMESSDKGKVDVNIEKSTESPGALGGASVSAAADMGAFAGAVAAALPGGITAVGDQYDFTAKEVGTDKVPEYKDKMTVQIQYKPASVSDTSLLNVYHYVSGAWTKEATNRTVDTENSTISVEVDSLSPFVAGEGTETTTTPTTTSGGSSSGCFIGTAASGFLAGWSLAGLMLLIGVSFLAAVRKKG